MKIFGIDEMIKMSSSCGAHRKEISLQNGNVNKSTSQHFGVFQWKMCVCRNINVLLETVINRWCAIKTQIRVLTQ